MREVNYICAISQTGVRKGKCSAHAPNQLGKFANDETADTERITQISRHPERIRKRSKWITHCTCEWDHFQVERANFGHKPPDNRDDSDATPIKKIRQKETKDKDYHRITNWKLWLTSSAENFQHWKIGRPHVGSAVQHHWKEKQQKKVIKKNQHSLGRRRNTIWQ